MKLSTGIDLIEIARVQNLIERYAGRFLERIFTASELSDCKRNIASLAARFAAKEAVSKALGTGIGPVAWQDIEILRGPAGEPVLHLHGSAAQKAAELGLADWSVSLSHSGEVAVAMAVAIGPSTASG